MSNIKRDPKLKLSDGLYRLDHADSDLFLSRPVWAASVATLGDYYKQLREISIKSNESYQSSESNNGSSSGNVTTSDNSTKFRSESGFISATVISSDNPNFQHPCPNNPIRTCNCGNSCADADFEPVDPKREGVSSWPWPCVVVGSVEQASGKPIQLVSESKHNSGHEDV